MNLIVNGIAHQVADGTSITDLLGPDRRRGSAVAVDGEVVPRAQWPHLRLQAGQRVEIVTAVQGG